MREMTGITIMTAGEIQARIKSGATLTKKGFEWDSKDLRKCLKQIQTYSYIVGLQKQIEYMSDYNYLIRNL